MQTPYAEIMKDLGKIVDRAFSRGAKTFVLCSQSTNYPNPEQVFAELPQYANVKLKHVEVVQDYSTNAKFDYKNYWAFYRG